MIDELVAWSDSKGYELSREEIQDFVEEGSDWIESTGNESKYKSRLAFHRNWIRRAIRDYGYTPKGQGGGGGRQTKGQVIELRNRRAMEEA